MADLIEFVSDPYTSHVRRVARWLRSRQPHLLERNLRTEVSRYRAALTCAHVEPGEADAQANVFARDVCNRLTAIEVAIDRESAATVTSLWPIDWSAMKREGLYPTAVGQGLRVSALLARAAS